MGREAERPTSSIWFSYVRTLARVDERIQALREFLRIDPGSRRTQQVLWMLWEKKCDSAAAEQRRSRMSQRRFFIALASMMLVVSIAGWAYVRQETLARWANRYETLLGQHNSLAQDHAALNSEHEALRVALNDLALDHNALVAEHDILIQQHAGLQEAYDGLVAQHAALQRQHDSLRAEHETLRAEHQDLEQAHNSLAAEYEWLNTNALSPPYISIDGREVYIAFLRTDGSVEHWEVPFESLESSLQLGAEMRQVDFWESAPMVHLNSTFTGETYDLWDYRVFVEPDPFRDVMEQLYLEAASDYDFIYETWHIVAQLTAYSGDIAETPRYPLETFLAGGGDCEDTSILFASMIKAAPLDWDIDLVYMDMDHPREPHAVNHVIVYVDTHAAQYLVETTGDDVMEPFDNVRGWYFEIE